LLKQLQENIANKQMKRMENSWVLTEKQKQIAVVGRTFTSPPLISNRYNEKKGFI
jgi:hypothetical protein